MNPKLLEILWLKHAYDGFPREVTTPWSRRVRCLNADNYTYLLWKGYGETDLFTSIYPTSFVNLDAQMTLNKIFFDIDDEDNPAIAYESMQKIVTYFRSRYGYAPRVNFSGKKGYHVYIDFDPIKMRIEYFKPVVRAFIDQVMKGSGAKIVDNSAIADQAGVTRVSRIPYSIHPKSGNSCIPIDPGWSMMNIKDHSKLGEGLDVIITKCAEIGDDLLELAYDVDDNQLPQDSPGLQAPTTEVLRSIGEKVFEILEIAPQYYDGRHRMIWAMLVPRLTILKSNGNYQTLRGDELQNVNMSIKEGVREFVELTPAINPDGTPRDPMEKYLHYTEDVLERLHKQFWSPWNFETFWCEYPDLAKYFRRDRDAEGYQVFSS